MPSSDELKRIAFEEIDSRADEIVKITKTKVLAAFGQIIEVLFGTGKFPIGVEPTPIPEGIAEYAHLNPQAQAQTQTPNQEQSPYGFPGDGMDLPAGATDRDILGGLKETFNGANFQEGAAPDLKSMPQIEPAKESAENMKKLILTWKN